MSIPRAQPKDNHTGTYVELDFDHTSERKKERPKLSEAADRDMNTTYAEISFHRKGEQKGKDVRKSPSDSETPVARCSDQPITEDPLYAVPEKVKLRKLYPKAGFDGGSHAHTHTHPKTNYFSINCIYLDQSINSTESSSQLTLIQFLN